MTPTTFTTVVPPLAAAGTFADVPAPVSVVVVDDDDSGRRALTMAVRALGYECRSARDGAEAWEMQQREPADVILSDWEMPNMDGLELCRRTRKVNDEGRYTYFIFMTSFSDKDHFVRGLEAGADDYQAKPVDLDELRARLVSAERVVGLYRRLAEQNTVLRRDSQTSFRAARVDALTKIGNRLAMDEELRVVWSRAKRYGLRYAVAICDIDHFKAFNDALGHLAGDEALRCVAQTIREQLREGDGLYRYGGEEFVAVLPEQTLTEAASAMQRVRAAISHLAIPAPSMHGVVTISCGVAELDANADADVEELLARADAALYRAKAQGRDRVETEPAPAAGTRSA